jgi:anti-sigma factor RsiW
MRQFKYWLFMALAVPAIAIAVLSMAVFWLAMWLRDAVATVLGGRNG